MDFQWKFLGNKAIIGIAMISGIQWGMEYVYGIEAVLSLGSSLFGPTRPIFPVFGVVQFDVSDSSVSVRRTVSQFGGLHAALDRESGAAAGYLGGAHIGVQPAATLGRTGIAGSQCGPAAGRQLYAV